MIFISNGRQLDGGYGPLENTTTINYLESLTLEKRKELIKDLKKEDSETFNEFYNMFYERMKKLGL